MGASFNDKHAKLDIVEDGKIKDAFLAGLTSSVLLHDGKQPIDNCS